MDFKKKIITLSSISGVLILTLILGITFSGEKVQKRKYDKKLLSYFNNKKATEIVITKNDEYIKLLKKDNKWNVETAGKNIVANKEQVEKLLNEIKNLKVGKKITKNESKFKNFGVSEDDTKKVVITDTNGAITALNFGDINENGKQYIRKQDDKIVYAAKNIDELLQTNSKNWYNLKIFSNIKKSSDIQSITIKGQNPETDKIADYTLIKTKLKNEKELQWKLLDSDEVVKQTEVNLLANTLTNLQAVDIEVKPLSLQNPNLVLTITKLDGLKHTLNAYINPENQNQYLANILGSETIYILSKYSISNIIKNKSSYINK